MKTRRTLYRDEYEQPIELEIRYRAGCELRCINTGCAAVPNHNNHNKTNDDKRWKKRRGKYIDIIDTGDNEGINRMNTAGQNGKQHLEAEDTGEPKNGRNKKQDLSTTSKNTKNVIGSDNLNRGGKPTTRKTLEAEEGQEMLVVSETMRRDGSSLKDFRGVTLYHENKENSKKSVLSLD